MARPRLTRDPPLLMLAASLLLALAAFPGDAFRTVSFESALAAAKKEKKLVVVAFASAASEESRKLEKTTLADSRVRAFLAERVVAIRVELEREEDLARRLRVEAVPTVLFVDAEGAELDRLTGFLEPQRFLSIARGSLQGKDALARARARVAADAKDVRARLEIARILLDRGSHAEALAELLWCFDHGAEGDPAFAAERTTTLLSEIARLGQAFPAALEQLVMRSNAAAERIRSGAMRPRDVEDVLAIDDKLSRSDHAVGLYDALKERPELAEARRRLAPLVLVVLLTDHRYADAIEAVGDPAAEFEKRTAALVEAEKAAGAQAPAGGGEELARRRRDTLRTGCEYYEMLLGARRAAEAAKVLDRVLAFDARVGTYEKLIDHAMRANQPIVAREVGRRGVLSGLSKPDKARLRTVIAGLPKAN